MEEDYLEYLRQFGATWKMDREMRQDRSFHNFIGFLYTPKGKAWRRKNRRAK